MCDEPVWSVGIIPVCIRVVVVNMEGAEATLSILKLSALLRCFQEHGLELA